MSSIAFFLWAAPLLGIALWAIVADALRGFPEQEHTDDYNDWWETK